MYVILAILVFCFLIFIHELGHFLAAKASGVRVLEFSLGMGPAIWSRQKGETLYSLRCLPLGGYCAMEGEDEDSDDPRAFTNAKVWKRLVILVAGAFMNFLTGFLLVLILFSGDKGFLAPVITGFMDGCPYESADGLQVGDRFHKVNGERIYFSSDVSTYLQRGGSETADIVVIRDGEKVELEDYAIVPLEYDYQGTTGYYYGLLMEQVDSGPWATVRYSWYQALDFVRQVRLALGDLITGAVGLDQMAGVVGIVDTINQVGQQSASTSLALWNIGYLSALIAVNLAVMNLLPIPALDGGRIVFLLLGAAAEKITRRKLSHKFENYLHGATLVLLMLLMLVVMYNDIARMVTR